MRKFKINERIIATNVMLILSNGKPFGQVSRSEALQRAFQEGLDLVEVSDGVVPTCKITDFGKMQYEKNKAEKHKHHTPALKEMRIKYKTDEHDIEIKRRKVDEFLTKGHKVVFSMIVKGRERFVGVDAAKERFQDIVRDFFPTANVNDIRENCNCYSITLHPIS